MRDTLPKLEKIPFPGLRRARLDTLQMNLGYLCNLSCVHCHVAAGPNRTELMDWGTMETALAFMERQKIRTLDVTGGSPEMNPHFRRLFQAAHELGVHLMDRCNPTIIEEAGFDWIPGFLAEHRVQVVASLPCYQSDNVEKQRGKGSFDKSIRGLQKLNELGYGDPDSGLELDLVYNPVGAHLPPEQSQLEQDYRAFLEHEFGLRFNRLFALANMPIKRWGSLLLSTGQFDDYMDTLRQSHRPENLAGVMCRDLISVDWQGFVYDCDFNQMLELGLGGERVHLADLLDRNLEGHPIRVSGHCYGCTAGQGSSCGGALSDNSAERPAIING
ncbi:arsenosugar biosynthesis radical SAM (seleno)protein ArsS [Natronospira bacteriovora]|uniref:Arsenosugar biosynthesis radical SAM protein ArsS n=1 Tax=Natronospira bacteriovora TaxID=3069753 RepID=A0ABU0W4F5_9GAMM|nr:arsenosugar biosynthesis radical SAM (seleno)protein ArsS [Natronospira sp. AB-CW4]MDQ2068899.1 arsenosugar biosynthesis radical SAM protein ArsS [Natronospira sp. AB-CW4]